MLSLNLDFPKNRHVGWSLLTYPCNKINMQPNIWTTDSPSPAEGTPGLWDVPARSYLVGPRELFAVAHQKPLLGSVIQLLTTPRSPGSSAGPTLCLLGAGELGSAGELG